MATKLLLVTPSIYQIRNLSNGKLYIGSALNFNYRKYMHCYFLKKNKHHNRHLQNAWNLYGEGSFIFEILEECSSNELLNLEQKYIDQYGFMISEIANKLNLGKTTIKRYLKNGR